MAGGLMNTVARRAGSAAGFNTETQQGSVTATYPDETGNIIAADVRIDGQVTSLVRVTNASGIRLWKGARVVVNWARGNRFSPEILSVSGASAGVNPPPTTGSTADTSTSAPDLSGVPVLLQDADDSAPDGYVMVPGANVSFLDTDPQGADAGTSGMVNGVRVLDVKPLVVPSLPDPIGLLDGTLADLVDSYGASQGMFRLDAVAGIWRRRDTLGGTGDVVVVGGSGTGTGTTEYLSTITVSPTDSTLHDEYRPTDGPHVRAAERTSWTGTSTEVTNARTRDAVGAFVGQSWLSLKTHLGAIWGILAGSVGGDLSGLLLAPTVAKIQGRTFAPTAPTDGQIPRWNDTTHVWEPSNESSGGGGGYTGSLNQTLRHGTTAYQASSFLTNDDTTVSINPASQEVSTYPPLVVRGTTPPSTDGSFNPNACLAVFGPAPNGFDGIPSTYFAPNGFSGVKIAGGTVAGGLSDAILMVGDASGRGAVFAYLRNGDLGGGIGTGHTRISLSTLNGGQCPLVLQEVGGAVGVGKLPGAGILLDVNGETQSQGYRSADGTEGRTGLMVVCAAENRSAIVKNGLIVAYVVNGVLTDLQPIPTGLSTDESKAAA